MTTPSPCAHDHDYDDQENLGDPVVTKKSRCVLRCPFRQIPAFAGWLRQELLPIIGSITDNVELRLQCLCLRVLA